MRNSAGIAAICCPEMAAMSAPAPDLVERLDRLLPQTQCGQCGYDG
ncbi:electron transport complex protein RnfB, partial [Xanthomonas vasicola]